MKGHIGRVSALVVSAAVVLALGTLSRAPYAPRAAQHGIVRLSWRARGVRVRECRVLTARELEMLPVHMRRPEVCEGRSVPYRLRVTIDDEPRENSLVIAAGAREDRPLYVYRELEVPPGRHRVSVEFSREGARTEDDTAPAATPARLMLDAGVSLGAGDVALITFDPEPNALVLRGGSAAASARFDANDGMLP